MKTIDLTQKKMEMKDLLRLAKTDSVLIIAPEGQRYILEEADAFDKEVAMLGGSDEFTEFLRKRSKEKAMISIDQLKRKLDFKDS